jgi:hypothetical protein
MSVKKIWAKLALALLILAQLVQIPAAAFTDDTAFSDVSPDAWYYDYVTECAKLEIVKGYPDGTFKPDKALTRGEFMCILANSSETLVIPQKGSTDHWASRYYDALNSEKVFAGLKITPYYQSMNTIITRYEMAVMVQNFLTNDQWESDVKVASPEKVITDYASIPAAYRSDVVQVYGKGIISGYGDGSFGGDNSLTRAQTCVVIKQILWSGQRKLASFVDTTVETAEAKPSGYVPAAIKWQNAGWINNSGTASASLKQVLFGSSSKSGFTSSSDASDYMKTVTVPVWKLSSDGSKYSSKTSITINKAVADDVVAIFTQIYNSPEKFPIESIGGARYTDTLRHSWGCAIDINPYDNAECRAYYNSDGSVKSVTQTCGQGWWPLGTSRTAFAGSLPEASAYSISRGGSVVSAFKAYGWGWAGNGYSVRNGSQKFDYMHFSIAANGA